MANITVSVNITSLWHINCRRFQHKGSVMISCIVGFQPFHNFFFLLLYLANMCNTFTEHHRASRFVTQQRHIVKTDAWLS